MPVQPPSHPTPTATPTTLPPPTPTRAPSPTAQEPATTGHTWYTSVAPSARYYYCDLDDGWKDLSPRNLRSYPSEADLRAAWGDTRTKHQKSRC
ncbi:MAG: hypothetical protein IT304_08150 [Dehalococcoidia bacterium]|nr:hypothetical protein [Dehalococcoidia bacterium]